MVEINNKVYIMPFWVEIVLIVLLVLISGMFSGLTLGLLSLSVDELKILIKAKSETYGAYAKRVLKVRRRGNWLLCSLILGNVVVNAGLTILVDDVIEDKLVSLVVSATVISFFGEILPLAVCSRKPLVIGYYTTYIVFAIMILFAPLSWPIAKLFDLILGKEDNLAYNNAELKELIKLQVAHNDAELSKSQGRIIHGALNYSKLTASDVMTPWNNVFRLHQRTKLTFDVLLDVFKSGNSRVPITDEADRAVGLLFAKDLILLDPEDETPAGSLLALFNRPLAFVPGSLGLKSLLTEFSSGRYHLAVVRSAEGFKGSAGVLVPGDGKDVFLEGEKMLGIITLEDVFERILDCDIVDETDVYVNSKKRNLVMRSEFDLKKLDVFDYRSHLPKKALLPLEISALSERLQGKWPTAVRSAKVHPHFLKLLLRLSNVIDVRVSSMIDLAGSNDKRYKLYEKGLTTEVCTLVLRGSVELQLGNGGVQILGLNEFIAEEVLSLELEGNTDPFIAKNDCFVSNSARVLLINRVDLREILGLMGRDKFIYSFFCVF